jgi:hypothetical protein
MAYAGQWRPNCLTLPAFAMDCSEIVWLESAIEVVR